MASNDHITTWLADLDPERRGIARVLRTIVRQAGPDLEEVIKWRNLVYQRDGLVCYLASARDYVSLGFFQGASLSDPHGRLEGRGKNLRHLKVRSLGQSDPDQIARWVQEAAGLNHGS